MSCHPTLPADEHRAPGQHQSTVPALPLLAVPQPLPGQTGGKAHSTPYFTPSPALPISNPRDVPLRPQGQVLGVTSLPNPHNPTQPHLPGDTSPHLLVRPITLAHSPPLPESELVGAPSGARMPALPSHMLFPLPGHPSSPYSFCSHSYLKSHPKRPCPGPPERPPEELNFPKLGTYQIAPGLLLAFPIPAAVCNQPAGGEGQ